MRAMKWLGVLGVLWLLQGTAEAGFKTGQQVVISTTSRLANGDYGYVYNSADTTQYIGCALYSSGSASCYARNAAGVYVSCYTTNPAILDAIRALGSDSYLIFYWDTGGNCTSVTVTNASYNPPKLP